jgi:predicted DNA-binding transcriptional regulator AlpA
MIAKNLDGWLSHNETMAILGIKVTTLWKLRSEGKLRYSKIGRKVYFDGKSIIALLEANSID